jgi:hypothetical protein
MAAGAKKTSDRAQIVELVETQLASFVEDVKAREGAASAASAALPAHAVARLDELLAKPDSYRDGLLTVLAAPLVRGERTDLRIRQSGWRGAADDVGRKVLRSLHIKGVKGAFEIIGKNTPELIRGVNAAWDGTLIWASYEATLDELRAAFEYVAAGIAATARSVEDRPRLRPAGLTFARVMRVLDAMLGEPSGGAHEQYIVAALLEAVVAREGTRVETKSMSASDRSSKAAGDVEVFDRGRLLEGIEVSANPWPEKLPQAEDAIRDYSLPRSHVVADAGDPGLYEALELATERDVSVLDVRAVVPVLVAVLDKRQREAALLRLYELLDEKLASPELVNAYVRRLREADLAEGSQAEETG